MQNELQMASNRVSIELTWSLLRPSTLLNFLCTERVGPSEWRSGAKSESETEAPPMLSLDAYLSASTASKRSVPPRPSSAQPAASAGYFSPFNLYILGFCQRGHLKFVTDVWQRLGAVW